MARNIFLFLILTVLCCVAQEEIGEIKRPGDLSKGDKEAILKLAQEIGIEAPVRIFEGQCHPKICDFLVVESAAKELGHLKCWLELKIHTEDWRADEGSITLRAGRWAAQRTELRVEENWIIEDNGWRLYVHLSPDAPFDVPFEDAELIVLAIRHDELINRLPVESDPFSPNSIFPKIDPSSITFMIRSKGLRTYDVYTGTGRGEVFTIKVVNGKAELHRRSSWFA